MNDVHVLTTYPEVYSEEKMTDVFPEARLHFTSGSATAPVDFSIENGKSYIVYFDYVDYKIDAANGSIANNLFSISVSDGTMTVSASDGYHTVGVTACETTYNKLPAAYYEDGGVSSWNDLTDKPFGDNEDGTVYQMSGKYVEGMGYIETVTKEVPVILVNWDGNTDGKAVHKVGMEDGYCHVSDIVIEDYRELLGKTVHYIYEGEKKTAVLDESKVKEDIYNGQTGFEFWDNEVDYFTVTIFSLPEEYVPWEGADPLPRGLYFSFDEGSGGGYVVGVDMGETTTETSETTHPIDQKLIVLTSPDGTKYNLSVADDGTLSAVAQT